MESSIKDQRPLKRARAISNTALPDRSIISATALDSRASSPDTVYRALESALNKLALLDRDQSLNLLKTHPETSKLLPIIHAQTTPAPRGLSVATTVADGALEKLTRDIKQLEAAFNQEVEARQKDKKTHESKMKSSTMFCLKILQANQAKIEQGLKDLREQVSRTDTSGFMTRKGQEAEIDRLHVLVAGFSERMSKEFKHSLQIGSKMLGHPLSEAQINPATAMEKVSPDADASEQTTGDEKVDEGEDEWNEGDEPSGEEEQDKAERESKTSKKLYSTDYVNKHPKENFYHRASGRWYKGLPPMEASVYTGVRGPDAQKWKTMKEKHEAGKPKTENKPDEPKKTEQGVETKGEMKMPGQVNGQDKASVRKIQQLEASVRDLQFKLKELRVKLEEEVRARRKAEAELESMRAGT